MNPKMNMTNLLHDPGTVISEAKEAEGIWRLIGFLLSLTLVGTSFFGAAIGAFVDWRMALLDAVKLSGTTLFAFVLCIPTLCVFSWIGGCRLSVLRLVGLGLVPLATLGCVLAATAPILLVFSVSTSSVAFIVLFAWCLGLGALMFAFRPIAASVSSGVVASAISIKIWLVILFVVVLQTITLVRPMLSPSGAERVPAGKCTFVQHFVEAVFETR